MSYPIILFFTSVHCAPCKSLKRMLNEVNISLFGNKLQIQVIDIEKEPELAQSHSVTSLPTLIIGSMRRNIIQDKNELTDIILQGFLSSVSISDISNNDE